MNKIVEILNSETDRYSNLKSWFENINNTESADVIDNRTEKSYKIWAIRNDSTGFPHFLIYDNNQWKWQSAKHFKPIQEA